MIKPKVYDVAISFAEEDVEIAESIKNALQLFDLKVYYYKNERGQNLGEKLREVINEKYYRSSRICLQIISEVYKKKTWTTYEARIIQKAHLEELTLPIPLLIDGNHSDTDDTEIIGEYWDDNPEVIAALILIKNNELKKKEQEALIRQNKVKTWKQDFDKSLVLSDGPLYQVFSFNGVSEKLDIPLNRETVFNLNRLPYFAITINQKGLLKELKAAELNLKGLLEDQANQRKWSQTVLREQYTIEETNVGLVYNIELSPEQKGVNKLITETFTKWQKFIQTRVSHNHSSVIINLIGESAFNQALSLFKHFRIQMSTKNYGGLYTANLDLFLPQEEYWFQRDLEVGFNDMEALIFAFQKLPYELDTELTLVLNQIQQGQIKSANETGFVGYLANALGEYLRPRYSDQKISQMITCLFQAVYDCGKMAWLSDLIHEFMLISNHEYAPIILQSKGHNGFVSYCITKELMAFDSKDRAMLPVRGEAYHRYMLGTIRAYSHARTLEKKEYVTSHLLRSNYHRTKVVFEEADKSIEFPQAITANDLLAIASYDLAPDQRFKHCFQRFLSPANTHRSILYYLSLTLPILDALELLAESNEFLMDFFGMGKTALSKKKIEGRKQAIEAITDQDKLMITRI